MWGSLVQTRGMDHDHHDPHHRRSAAAGYSIGYRRHADREKQALPYVSPRSVAVGQRFESSVARPSPSFPRGAAGVAPLKAETRRRSWAGRYAPEQILQGDPKRGDEHEGRVAYDRKVDSEVIVNEHVAHTGDFTPGNCGRQQAHRVGDALRGLPEHARRVSSVLRSAARDSSASARLIAPS